MSMPNYLAKIKSSGVYRYVFDKSTIPASERNSLRLVVGYSERGPFNTPVFISDANEFISTFGNISRRMERKGVYFHRLALQALEAGPILALNIKPFKNESAKMLTFNASDIKCMGEMEVTIPADSIKLTAYKADGSKADLEDKFFVKPVPDYAFVDEKSMSFVGSLSASANYVRTIEAGQEIYWTAEEDVHGASVPEDGGAVVPAHFDYTHTFFQDKYYENTKGKIKVAGKQADKQDLIMDDALIALDGTNVAGEKLTTIYDTNRFWRVTDNLMNISPMAAGGSVKRDFMRIVQTSSKEDSVTVFMRPYVPSGYDIKISDWFAQESTEDMPAYLESLKDHYLSEFFMEIYVFRGDFRNADLFAEAGTLGTHSRGADGISKFYPFCEVSTEKSGYTTVRTNSGYLDAFGRPADALDAMTTTSTSNFLGKYQGIMLPHFKDTNGSPMSIDTVFNSDYAVHKCLMAMDEQLLDDAYEVDMNDNGIYDDTESVPSNPSGNWGGISDLVHALASGVHYHEKKDNEYGDKYEQYETIPVPTNASVVGYYLEGYTYSTILRNESGKSMVEDKIMAVLGYKGIYEALTNNVDVDYKYWVDTFQGFPGVSMKSDIAAIIKQKFNALGILNFPPMMDCATFMGYPGLTGGFDMKEVTKKGSGITLPAEVQGASWVAFYTQLQMTDGSNKFTIPSAALVSNLFMQKWSTRLPYYIVAGPNYGRIEYPGVLGPDYNYARHDLDELEPFGVNAIVYIPRKGVIINSNQTAKQTPVTALSKVHVRELITYLQDTVEDMLRGYQWELNTSTLRDAISSKCQTYCDLIKANGGIYDYRVTCDETNNTPETIDNEMVIVDIEIEPGRGNGKLVQTLTIHRTGGLSSSPRN